MALPPACLALGPPRAAYALAAISTLTWEVNIIMCPSFVIGRTIFFKKTEVTKAPPATCSLSSNGLSRSLALHKASTLSIIKKYLLSSSFSFTRSLISSKTFSKTLQSKRKNFSEEVSRPDLFKTSGGRRPSLFT